MNVPYLHISSEVSIGFNFRSRLYARRSFHISVEGKFGALECCGAAQRLLGGQVLRGTERAGLVPEHAGVAPLVAARVYQLPLLALIERHVTAGASSSGRF